jgi:DNA-binding protein
LFRFYIDETPLTEEELSYHKITVATVRGRPYYNITCALRLMDLQFDSLSPEEAAVSNAKVIITTQDEAGIVNKKGIVMIDTELEKYPAIAKAKILRSIMGERVVDDQLIIGIDPGSRIGISAIYLHQEIASAVVESSPQDAINHVAAMLGGIESRKKVVKIGDGNIAMAIQIARMLKMKFKDSVSIEIVDEHGTSLPQNTDANRRGVRDRSSARAIAFRSGKSFTLK